jgi:hypothetical protein
MYIAQKSLLWHAMKVSTSLAWNVSGILTILISSMAYFLGG